MSRLADLNGHISVGCNAHSSMISGAAHAASEKQPCPALAKQLAAQSARYLSVCLKRSQHYVKIPALPVQWDGNDSRRCDHYRSKGSCCLSAQYDMRLGDPILTARILLKGPNRRWGSTSVTGRLSWLEHNGHRVASPRPQHASKRHSGTYVGGSQLGSICHSAKPTTWPHRLMATAVVAVAQLPINGGLPTLPLAMHCHDSHIDG